MNVRGTQACFPIAPEGSRTRDFVCIQLTLANCNDDFEHIPDKLSASAVGYRTGHLNKYLNIRSFYTVQNSMRCDHKTMYRLNYIIPLIVPLEMKQRNK